MSNKDISFAIMVVFDKPAHHNKIMEYTSERHCGKLLMLIFVYMLKTSIKHKKILQESLALKSYVLFHTILYHFK